MQYLLTEEEFNGLDEKNKTALAAEKERSHRYQAALRETYLARMTDMARNLMGNSAGFGGWSADELKNYIKRMEERHPVPSYDTFK